MEIGILLVAILFLGLVVVVVVGTSEQRAPRNIARALRARSNPGAGLWEPSVEWTIRGRRAELKETTVTVDLRGQSPGTLKIVSEPEGLQVATLYEGQDLSVGESSFDARFVVKASPASLVGTVFSRERRARMTASVMRLAQFGPPIVDLSRERLRISFGGATRSKAALAALAECATEWVEVLLEVETTADVLWIAHDSSVGLCQVCGSEMQSGVVDCARCRTPHHEECWKWTGECSTFACKETRYVVGGRTVSPPPRRQKPDDWLRDELDRDRRATGGAPPSVQDSLRRFERRQRERRR